MGYIEDRYPNFKAGVHCTECRTGVLPTPKFEDFPYVCGGCITGVRAWKARSDRAKAAAKKRKAMGCNPGGRPKSKPVPGGDYS